ncbi:hypothetical protein [Acetivibrio cellulolyticus]|uniref:hypothetical protein n=1 Tax=Acetivibrio cellulolyticus TaxID=35830 RepID=UPI0002481B6A|nr:hypothetical protein [Acetivibrio cellulolyticus]
MKKVIDIILKQGPVYICTADIDWENDKIIELNSEQLDIIYMMKGIEVELSEIIERNGYGGNYNNFSPNGEQFRDKGWKNIIKEFSIYATKLQV